MRSCAAKRSLAVSGPGCPGNAKLTQKRLCGNGRAELAQSRDASVTDVKDSVRVGQLPSLGWWVGRVVLCAGLRPPAAPPAAHEPHLHGRSHIRARSSRALAGRCSRHRGVVAEVDLGLTLGRKSLQAAHRPLPGHRIEVERRLDCLLERRAHVHNIEPEQHRRVPHGWLHQDRAVTRGCPGVS